MESSARRSRIVIVGGGSPYVPGIVWSLAHSGEVLAESEIVLMDIDPSRLSMMSTLASRMVKEAGTSQTVSSTTDLKQALEDATFVLTNFRPGGLEGLRLDERIPDKYAVLADAQTLEVEVQREQSMNELFARLSELGISVLSMRNKQNRLEQLFIDLVDSDRRGVAS